MGLVRFTARSLDPDFRQRLESALRLSPIESPTVTLARFFFYLEGTKLSHVESQGLDIEVIDSNSYFHAGWHAQILRTEGQKYFAD